MRVNANCSTSTVSLDDDECVSGGSFLPNPAVTKSITRVLSVCGDTLNTLLLRAKTSVQSG